MRTLLKLFLMITMLGLLNVSFAGDTKKRTFTEDEFITVFSGKPKARVLKYLGEPDNKEIAIKPKGAQGVVGSKVRIDDKKQRSEEHTSELSHSQQSRMPSSA